MLAAVPLLCALCLSASAADDAEWVATWAASDMAANTTTRSIATLENFTSRQVVRSSIGGDALRLRISNVFGDRPLILAGATVAVHSSGAAVVPGTLTIVTFGGAAAASIPAGEFLYSDAVPLRTEAFTDLAVSLYFPQALPALTRHGGTAAATYVSPSGNFILSETVPAARETENALFLTGVEVATANNAPLIVCFGDSITEGAGAEEGRDWPALLARRLNGEAGVIRQAITGNRLLRDFAGESALRRFERDVLSWEGLDYVIVALGINDLGYTAIDASVLPAGVEAGAVSAADLIDGYRQLLAMAHARGVRVIGTTLTPFNGSNYFSEQGEATRVAVNQWIRESEEFDAIVDFDAILRDPAQPDRFAPGLHNDGDWLHPNAAGYQALADSIDLSIFDANSQ